jgi:hypothetical protein
MGQYLYKWFVAIFITAMDEKEIARFYTYCPILLQRNKFSSFGGFEVLTAVVMMSSTFQDIMLCSLVKVDKCFRGTCCLHL